MARERGERYVTNSARGATPRHVMMMMTMTTDESSVAAWGSSK